ILSGFLVADEQAASSRIAAAVTAHPADRRAAAGLSVSALDDAEIGLKPGLLLGPRPATARLPIGDQPDRISRFRQPVFPRRPRRARPRWPRSLPRPPRLWLSIPPPPRPGAPGGSGRGRSAGRAGRPSPG